MKARFELDIAPSSISMNHTPSLAARDLPCYLQSWGRFQARAGYFTERSEYDSFLFLYTIGGSGLITYRGREYSLSPEQAVFIDCSEYHFYRTGPEGFWELEWLHINGTALRHYFELLNGTDLQLMTMAAAPDVPQYLGAIHRLLTEDDPTKDYRFVPLVLEILTQLVTAKLHPTDSRYRMMIEQILTYIATNYSAKLRCDDFLELTHLSKFHLLRLFKKHTGVSLYEYLTNYRINVSKSLLRETQLTVTEIAARVGYGSPNNYIREFKKLAGTTPLQYRNRQSE